MASYTPEQEKMVLEYIDSKPWDSDYRILKANLTKEIWNKYKDKKTSTGGSLWDCIKSGILCPDSKMGAYLCDRESVDLYQELFEPMIKQYFNTNQYHPECNFGDLESEDIKELLDLKRLDTDGTMIKSTRVRVARNLDGYPYAASLTDKQRCEVESKIADGVKKFTGDLAGTYTTLGDYTAEQQLQMVENHILFHNRDEYIEKAGMYGDWPRGRGVFYNADKTFMIWVNEEDHMRVISLIKGNDLLHCYGRLVKACNSLNEVVPLAKHNKWGMLSSCPTNLGTGLRASVHIMIPKTSALKCFNALCKDMRIDIRGIHGEHSESSDGTFDIPNKRRFGMSEIDCLGEMARGVKNLIRIEKALNGKDCV
jgi:creatine kinase